jgi:SRSO17 transposase
MDWRGVRSPVERQTGWQVAAQAGQETPDATQPLLGRAVWSAEEVRDARRADVVEPLGEADGVVVIDETGLLKTGTPRAGVQRQYCGTAGRIETCQFGGCLTYATRHGRTGLDREWSRPQAWATDLPRRTAAGIPPEGKCATKLGRARMCGAGVAWSLGS